MQDAPQKHSKKIRYVTMRSYVDQILTPQCTWWGFVLWHPVFVGTWESAGTINFDNIDLESKKARMIANAGAEGVMALVYPTGRMFVEKTGVGNFIFITVFPSYLNNRTVPTAPKTDSLVNAQLTKAFLAVMSRHLFNPLSNQQSHLSFKVIVEN